MDMYGTLTWKIKNGWLNYDHRLMYKKYTTPLPYSWDVGWQKDILRWRSQQKKHVKNVDMDALHKFWLCYRTQQLATWANTSGI